MATPQAVWAAEFEPSAKSDKPADTSTEQPAAQEQPAIPAQSPAPKVTTSSAETAKSAPEQGKSPEAPPVERARRAYELGSQQYAHGDYAAALESFQDAQSLYPSADFHYNIGQCYEQLEKYDQAIGSYRAYLRGKPGAPDAVNVQNRIARLEKLEAVAQAPRPVANPPAAATANRESSTGAENQRELVRTQGPAKNKRKALLATGITLSSLGVPLAAVGGIVFGLRARDRSQRVEDAFTGGNPQNLSYNELTTLNEEGRQAEQLQIASIAVGATLAAGGLTALLFGLKQAKAQARGTNTTAGRGSRGRLRWQAHVHRRYTGLTLKGAF